MFWRIVEWLDDQKKEEMSIRKMIYGKNIYDNVGLSISVSVALAVCVCALAQ